MITTPTPIPLRHDARHHGCAWCGHLAPSVPALLDHVVDSHLGDQCAA
jgi:hypothetical protein